MSSTRFRPELFGAANTLLLDYLCFRPGESLLVTTDTAGDQEVVQAIAAAAIAAGGRPSVLAIPQLPFQGKLADPFLPEPLVGAAERSDVWIDLTFPYIAGADLHDRVMKAGRARYFLASDLDAGGLLRLFGGVDLDAYFRDQARFDQRLAASIGAEVRIATALGTDVRFALAKPGLHKPRHADRPGMYLIPGAVTLTPEIETVRGRIVVETVFHEYYTALDEPITLEVEGRVRAVSGGGPERAVLDRALRRAGEGGYGYVIHFTHGLHPAARFTRRCFVEDMRVCGNDAVGMGLPWWAPGGGENHPDAVLSMQSIWIGGELVVDAGRAVG